MVFYRKNHDWKYMSDTNISDTNISDGTELSFVAIRQLYPESYKSVIVILIASFTTSRGSTSD